MAREAILRCPLLFLFFYEGLSRVTGMDRVSSGDESAAPTASSPPAVLSDFSIEHILRTAGNSGKPRFGDRPIASDRPLDQGARFEWLQCTRYHPPKLPRSRRKDSRLKEIGGCAAASPGKCASTQQPKRKLGRNPRIPFSSSQVLSLEQRFRRGHYLSSADVAALSSCLRLSETRVKIWFQNRRARERRDREAAAAKASGDAPQRTTAPPPSAHREQEARIGAPPPPSDQPFAFFQRRILPSALSAPSADSAFLSHSPLSLFRTTFSDRQQRQREISADPSL